MEITRRQFLKGSLAAGALATAGGMGVLLTPQKAHAFYQSPKLQKFVQALRGIGGTGIPVMTPDVVAQPWWQSGVTHYTIDVGQYQDLLHPSLGPTRLRGYGQSGTFKHLGGIIATKRGVPVQITFRNNIPAGKHMIPVDMTFPDSNRPSNRTAVHLHGGLVPWISDGGPFDWWNPEGKHGLSFLNNQVLHPGAEDEAAEFYYPNGQGARLLWYHDHAHDITRVNAYAGIASGYVIYDDYELDELVEDDHLPGPLDPRTIYLIFQDKIFVDKDTIGEVDPTWPGPFSTGSLWYAHVYDRSRWALGPHPAGLPPDPSVVPEFFGDTILVNGTVYPYLEVEQRQYRIRMLNACNARFLNPRLVFARAANPTEPSPNTPGPVFIQFGSEGGFLPHPAMLNGPGQPLLTMAPAERGDFIVDFRSVPAGSILILYSDASAPFPGGDPRNDYHPGNPSTPSAKTGFGPNTRTLLQFRVKTRLGPADPNITLPNPLTPTDPFLVTQKPGVPIVPSQSGGYANVKLANGTTVQAFYRYLTLNEAFDTHGRLIQYMGTNVVTNLGGAGNFGREYMSTPTEVVQAGSYEVWEILNLTGDTHPWHFHLVNVQVLSRQPFNAAGFTGTPQYTGSAIAPDKNEMGWKETVRMNPGQATRVFMKFDLPSVPFIVPPSPRTGGNEYVHHCHILEHEEHDMMRPLVVV